MRNAWICLSEGFKKVYQPFDIFFSQQKLVFKDSFGPFKVIINKGNNS